jgi:hypothetical protein
MKLTYANVMSTIAVFGVLGGGAYAAGKIGANGIKDDAIHSRHIKDGQVTRKDLLLGDISRSYGSDIYFGRMLHFGPVPDGMGSSQLTSFTGDVDADATGPDPSGGAKVLLPPVAVRPRDMLMRASSAVERPVRLEIQDLDAESVVFSCAIPAGGDRCSAKGPGPVLRAGSRYGLYVDALIAGGTLNEHFYEYSLRLTPP